MMNALLFAIALVQPTIPPVTPWQPPRPLVEKSQSGARVVVSPSHALPLVHVVATVQAGSDQDPPSQPGLASAVAMMLQEGGAGARTPPQLALAFADLGAELQVGVDASGVRLGLTVLSRNLDAALALLGDLLARPRFDASEWPRARAQRLAEIERRRDEPRAIADAVFARVVFGDHPYGHAAIGTAPSVRALEIDALKQFYAAHYGPRTVSFVLTGDVTPARATAAIDRALAGWQSSAAPSPVAAPAANGTRFVLVDRPGAPQSEVRIGHVGRARSTPDYPALKVLETVLGGSFTSRLVQNLREKHGYTYGVSSRFALWRAAGPFAVVSAVRTDVTSESLREIVAELGRIVKPLGDDELRKGRALVEQSLVETFSDGRLAATVLADLAVNDMPLDALTTVGPALGKLDLAGVTYVAAQLFHPNALTVVVVGDRKVIEPKLKTIAPTIEYRDVDGNPLP
jgi:zinc protease